MNENYFKITSRHDANDVYIEAVGVPPEWGMQFSLDGLIWATCSVGGVIPVNAGESIWFRNDSETLSKDNDNYYKITSTKSFDVSGDASTLLNYTVDHLESMRANALNNLFKNSMVVDASQLVLPSVTSSYGCASMFSGCQSLEYPPQFPADELKTGCYQGIFYACRNLLEAPVLPSRSLAANCYLQMFYGCSKLESVDKNLLPATTLAGRCYDGMFQNCAALKNAPNLPATDLATRCYNSMFNGCSQLTQAPELPAETLTDQCYRYMFNGCSQLTQAPELPAKTLATSCYERMFNNCSRLNGVICDLTEFNTDSTAGWLANVSPTGRFFYTSKSLDVGSIPRDENGIPPSWTVLRGIPQHGLKLNSKPVRFLLVNGNMVDIIGSRRVIPVPGDPLAWFDAIDNVDFDVHSTDTQTWYNLAEDKSITAERTSQWTWGDNAALFTEQYNQVFKVVQSGDSILNSMGNEWSIHISAYLDVASKRTYVGLFGGEPGGENAVAPAVALDGTGWLFLKGNPTSSTTINSTNWNWFGQVNSYLKYDDFNTLTVVASPQRRVLFVNGQIAWEDNTQLADYKTLLRTATPKNTNLYIGRSSNQNLTSGSGRVIRGKVHNFLIYRRALIDDECRSLYTYSNERFNS